MVDHYGYYVSVSVITNFHTIFLLDFFYYHCFLILLLLHLSLNLNLHIFNLLTLISLATNPISDWLHLYMMIQLLCLKLFHLEQTNLCLLNILVKPCVVYGTLDFFVGSLVVRWSCSNFQC